VTDQYGAAGEFSDRLQPGSAPRGAISSGLTALMVAQACHRMVAARRATARGSRPGRAEREAARFVEHVTSLLLGSSETSFDFEWPAHGYVEASGTPDTFRLIEHGSRLVPLPSPPWERVLRAARTPL
jgi:hypothetical protein